MRIKLAPIFAALTVAASVSQTDALTITQTASNSSGAMYGSGGQMLNFNFQPMFQSFSPDGGLLTSVTLTVQFSGAISLFEPNPGFPFNLTWTPAVNYRTVVGINAGPFPPPFFPLIDSNVSGSPIVLVYGGPGGTFSSDLSQSRTVTYTDLVDVSHFVGTKPFSILTSTSVTPTTDWGGSYFSGAQSVTLTYNFDAVPDGGSAFWLFAFVVGAVASIDQRSRRRVR